MRRILSLMMLSSLLICSPNATAASAVAANDAFAVIAGRVADHVGIVERTVAGFGIGDFVVLRAVRGLGGRDVITIAYNPELLVVPRIGERFLVVLVVHDSDDMRNGFCHPLQMRSELADYDAVVMLPLDLGRPFLGSEFTTEREQFEYVDSVIRNNAEKLASGFLDRVATKVCKAETNNERCLGHEPDMDGLDVFGFVYEYLLKQSRRTSLTDDVSQDLALYGERLVLQFLREQSQSFRSPEVRTRLAILASAAAGRVTSADRKILLRFDRQWFERIVASYGSVTIAKAKENVLHLYGAMWETSVPFSRVHKKVVYADAKPIVAHLSLSVVRHACRNCVRICREWARQPEPVLRLVGAECLMPHRRSESLARVRELLKVHETHLWSLFVLARQGDRQALTTALGETRGPELLPTLDETLLREELIALAVNSLSHSGSRLPTCSGARDECLLELISRWELDTDAVVYDPWKNRTASLALE